MSGVWLLLQLVFGFAVVLAPGALVARTIGVRSVSATLAWSLAVVFAALAVTFLVGGSLTLTLVLVLAGGAAALAVGIHRQQPGRLVAIHGSVPHRSAVAGVGALVGLLLWHVAGHVGGDGFFHLARIQKLLAFGDLSLSSANEFPDGGLHPGYAFPLWHGFLALVAKTSGAEPVDVVLHAPTVLAPLLVLVVYEAGWALFRRPVPAAASVAAGVAIAAMAPCARRRAHRARAPGDGIQTGARARRARAGPRGGTEADDCDPRDRRSGLARPCGRSTRRTRSSSGSRSQGSWRCDGSGSAGTRAKEGWRSPRSSSRPGSSSPGFCPSIADTASVAPDASERTRAFDQYAGQLTGTADRFSVVPELFGRTGAVAVAALLLIPLAGLASRRRWAAYVVGGSLAVFVLCLVPWVFTPFSDVVSLSQSRRLAGFLPFAFALAGGMGVLARLLGRATAPVALAVGIVLQLAYPGDFGYALDHGGPAWATWIAVLGVLVALGLGFRRRPPLERTAALASALVLLPTYAHGLTHWTPSDARRPNPLTDSLVAAVHERGSGRRDRLRHSGGELPPRRPRADPRVCQPARARRRHGREPAAGAGGGVPPLRPDRRPRHPARVRRDLASSSTATDSPGSVPTCRSSTATSGGSSTGSEARLGPRVRSPP